MEIDGIATPREIIFAVFLLGVLLSVGCIVHTKIVRCITDHNLKVDQTLQIRSDDQFRHCLDTSVGDVFAEGELSAVDAVTDDKGHLSGSYWRIERRYQVYTMHTRIVHYTTGSGKNLRHHTRTETYWTWDTHDVDVKSCTKAVFCGVTFPKSKFSVQVWEDSHDPVEIGYHKRYVYTTYPKRYCGTLAATCSDATIGDGSPFYPSQSPKDVHDGRLVGNGPVIAFWIGTVLVIGLLIWGFLAIDNRWLESRGTQRTGFRILN